RLQGASGLHIGAIQCVDIALGIRSESQMGKAAYESRKYYPLQHRNFLEVLDSTRSIIRDFVTESNDDGLRNLYNECIGIMDAFRVSHQVRGAEYLKGDNTPKKITSTGLSMSAESN